jgi:DNA polymerase III subunit chi
VATAVEFHTGVADKLGFACRLLRKAYRKGARLVVTAPAPLLATLDRELWTFAERDFIPHLRVTASVPPATSARTPIWLVDGEAPDGAPAVLVNLGAPAPVDPARFERIIEVISDDAADLQPGRERWRAYLAAGLSPVRHASPAGEAV